MRQCLCLSLFFINVKAVIKVMTLQKKPPDTDYALANNARKIIVIAPLCDIMDFTGGLYHWVMH